MIFQQWCKDQGIPVPLREFKFHEHRKWRFDYAWPEYKLAIEVEGGVYGRGKKCPVCGQSRKGAHSSVTGILRDIEKYNMATVFCGWRVYRVLPDKLLTLSTINDIKEAMELL